MCIHIYNLNTYCGNIFCLCLWMLILIVETIAWTDWLCPSYILYTKGFGKPAPTLLAWIHFFFKKRPYPKCGWPRQTQTNRERTCWPETCRITWPYLTQLDLTGWTHEHCNGTNVAVSSQDTSVLLCCNRTWYKVCTDTLMLPPISYFKSLNS